MFVNGEEKKEWPRTIAAIERVEKGCEWHKTYNYYYSMLVTGNDPMRSSAKQASEKKK